MSGDALFPEEFKCPSTLETGDVDSRLVLAYDGGLLISGYGGGGDLSTKGFHRGVTTGFGLISFNWL